MAYHTDKFLKARKNDPNWREAYLERRYDKVMCILFAVGGAIVGATLGFIIGPILFP